VKLLEAIKKAKLDASARARKLLVQATSKGAGDAHSRAPDPPPFFFFVFFFNFTCAISSSRTGRESRLTCSNFSISPMSARLILGNNRTRQN